MRFPNEITGPNASGLRQFPIREPLDADPVALAPANAALSPTSARLVTHVQPLVVEP